MSLTPARAKSLQLVLTAAFTLQGVLSTVMIPRIPELIDQLQVNFTAWGAIIGFSALGALVALAFANQLIVRFGSRPVLQVSAVAFAASLMPLPFVSNPFVFFALQAAMAFAGSTLNVVLNSQAVVLQGFLNRTIIPKFHASWSIGAASSAALGAYLAGVMPLWLHFLLIPGIAAVLIGWVTSFALDSEEIGKSQQAKTGRKVPFWKSPWQLWLISIGWFAGVFPEAAIMDWSAIFGRKVLLLDASLSAVPYTGFILAMIISRLSIARLTRNRRVGVVSFWSGIVGASALGLGAWFGPLLGESNKLTGLIFTTITWFIAGLCIGPMSPTFTAASGQVKGLSTAQGMARASLITSILMMGAKVVMGAVAQGVNLAVAFLLPTLLFFVAAVISGLLAKDVRQAKLVVEDAFPITGAIAVIPPTK